MMLSSVHFHLYHLTQLQLQVCSAYVLLHSDDDMVLIYEYERSNAAAFPISIQYHMRVVLNYTAIVVSGGGSGPHHQSTFLIHQLFLLCTGSPAC